MPSHRAAPPSRHRAETRHKPRHRRNAAPPLAVLAVGGGVALVIGTAQAGGAATKPVASSQQVATESPATVAAQTASLPDVAQALHALADITPHHQTRASRSSGRALMHRWVLPAHGPLTSPFGWRWGRLHAGIDLGAPYGAPIFAATDGCITYAGPEGGYGEVIKIRDWDGTETVYGHMESFVRTSGCVHAGQEIAHVGAMGDATGPHLHFEVHVDGVPVDPAPFLARRGVHV